MVVASGRFGAATIAGAGGVIDAGKLEVGALRTIASAFLACRARNASLGRVAGFAIDAVGIAATGAAVGGIGFAIGVGAGLVATGAGMVTGLTEIDRATGLGTTVGLALDSGALFGLAMRAGGVCAADLRLGIRDFIAARGAAAGVAATDAIRAGGRFKREVFCAWMRNSARAVLSACSADSACAAL